MQEKLHALKEKYGEALSREQAAEALLISISTLDRLKKKDAIRRSQDSSEDKLKKNDESILCPYYYKVGRQYRFPVEKVVEFIYNNPYYRRKVL
ncbi:MAG: hypothetical protein FAF04_00600 [Epsilonproteobacteria bacterium]|nr:hypothetical protein [Campylobacterota bacterium]